MSDQSAAERREFLRFTTWAQVKYVPAGSKEKVPAATRNISRAGIGFFTKSRFSPGTVLHLRLKLPGAKRMISFTGEVAWSGPLLLVGRDGSPHAHETGVRILKIAAKDQQILNSCRP